MVMKPRLCGVLAYSGPGLPRPTMRNIDRHLLPVTSQPSTAWSACALLVAIGGLNDCSLLFPFLLAFLLLALGGFAFLYLLALLDHFGLRWSSSGGLLNHGFSRLLLFLLQHDHMNQNLFRIAGQPVALIGRNILHANRFAETQVRHVDRDVF